VPAGRSPKPSSVATRRGQGQGRDGADNNDYDIGIGMDVKPTGRGGGGIVLPGCPRRRRRGHLPGSLRGGSGSGDSFATEAGTSQNQDHRSRVPADVVSRPGMILSVVFLAF
jgi:hypothetical protein